MFIWTIWDALTIYLLIVVVVLGLLFSAWRWATQTICAHDGGIGETQACDAICQKCGKNLGFIGRYRHLAEDK